MGEKVALEIDEGTRKSLVELLSLTRILQDSLSDQAIQDLSKLLGALFKILNAISGTDLIDLLERGLQDPELDKAMLDPPKVGLVGLLKALRDHDFQRGLGILIAVLRAIGKASKA